MAASASSSGVIPLAPSQGLVLGTANLGGIDDVFFAKKAYKCAPDTVPRVLDKNHKKALVKQALAMRAERADFIVFTELNKHWAPELKEWLEGKDCDDSMKGWTLRHDGDGVALLWAPSLQPKDDPEVANVYDEDMLMQDLASSKKLNWRVVTTGCFSLSDRPAQPTYYISGVHVYSGRDGQKRDASVNEAQKKRIAIYSLMRPFKDNSSILAEIEAGKCVHIFAGDFNLAQQQIVEVCKNVLEWIRTRQGPECKICCEKTSSLDNRDWVISFFVQGLVLPLHIKNSEAHLKCYPTPTLAQHQPVVVDFGAVRMGEELVESEALASPRASDGPSEEDYHCVGGQLREVCQKIVEATHLLFTPHLHALLSP